MVIWNKSLLVFFVLIVSLFFAGKVFATTYYVDSQGGDDSNDGVSEATAWETVSKVSDTVFSPGDFVLFKRGGVWRTPHIVPSSGDSSGYVTYGAYGTGPKPLFLGSVSLSDESDWTNLGGNLWGSVGESFIYDVGFVLLGEESTESVGRKKFSLDELSAERDYYWDQGDARVVVYSPENPGSRYSKVEVAKEAGRHFVAGANYVKYEDLAVKYWNDNAFTIAGQNVEIRRCEVTYGGGGMHDSGLYRFGNGVEIWQYGQDILVENCTFGQIYDTAMTPQAHSYKANIENVLFRNNVAYKSGLACYEIRFHNLESTLNNIRFEDNICIGDGRGWGRNGDYGYGVSYINDVSHAEFYISGNVLYESKPSAFAVTSGVKPTLMDNNYYYQSSGNMIKIYDGAQYPMSEFSSYQVATGLDENSVSGDLDALRDKAFSMVGEEHVPLLNELFLEFDFTFVPRDVVLPPSCPGISELRQRLDGWKNDTVSIQELLDFTSIYLECEE
jgi:hypothetical protein